ncbi:MULTISPECIES: DM13 domain-containing protein [unclassified Synechococcus]|jgi:hypothetical protein|uniref:DM13 domain-containing protein n=1 Tax=unclassified Synechococcus TaxID=2626047 RepID=UPI001E477C30|nr:MULTISPECIES: DM13 domain-containing protein [unclassified Synechococcus]
MTLFSSPVARSSALALVGATLLWGAALHAESMSKPMTKPMQKEAAGMTASAMAKGNFRMGEKPVSGGFSIHSEGGKQVLKLSKDFKTSDTAPDLKIVFSPSPTPLASSKAPAYPLKPGSYTILAPLKTSQGGQSYTIPASIDLSKQGSVLIWCQKFNATMAWAPLKS